MQILGSKTIDFRSDLWSLAVVAFEAMTGERPFTAETLGRLAMAICSAPLPVPSKLLSSLPRSIDVWFERAFARDVEVALHGRQGARRCLRARCGRPGHRALPRR